MSFISKLFRSKSISILLFVYLVDYHNKRIILYKSRNVYIRKSVKNLATFILKVMKYSVLEVIYLIIQRKSYFFM